jgi:hypothetical protein
VSFSTITLCVASQGVFIVVSVYFVIDSVRKPLDTPSYHITVTEEIARSNYKYIHKTCECFLIEREELFVPKCVYSRKKKCYQFCLIF